ncbi:hypothetical protein DITRI_Ditri04bG0148800 [Diplodiscus trichospermus]
MGYCMPAHNPWGEVCFEKAMIEPGKFSSPLEANSPSCTSPDYKRPMGPAISSVYPQDAASDYLQQIKLQLRELLSKRISVEEMLVGVHIEGRYRVDFVRKWQPLLETIPEASDQ